MATANQNANFVITAKNAASSVFRTIGKDMGGLGTVAKRISGVLAGLGVSVAGLGFLLRQTFMDAVKGAIEEQRQIRVLTGLLESRFPKAASKFVDAVNKQIEVLQALGFADSEVRDSFEIATRFTSKAAEATAIQAAAADLARAKGISLAEATLLIGKAMKGQTRGLKDLGINLKKGAKLTDILRAVTNKYGTAAEDFTDTIEGRALIAQIRFNDAMESAGTALLPAVSSVLETLTPYLEQFSAWVTENSPQIEEFFRNLVRVMTEEVLPRVGEFADRVISAFQDNYPKLEAFFKDKGALLAVALVTAFTGKLSFGLSAGLISLGVDPMVAAAAGLLGTAIAGVVISAIGARIGASILGALGLGTAAAGAAAPAAGGAAAAAGLTPLAAIAATLTTMLGVFAVQSALQEEALSAYKSGKTPFWQTLVSPWLWPGAIGDLFRGNPYEESSYLKTYNGGVPENPNVYVTVTLDGDKVADKVTTRVVNGVRGTTTWRNPQ